MNRRAELHRIVDEIAQSAHERIDDPKNVAKGDGWTDMDWSELFMRLDEEKVEFVEQIFYGRPDRSRPEGGDVLAFMAMQIDKAETIHRAISERVWS